jgi:glutamate decarboxylase
MTFLKPMPTTPNSVSDEYAATISGSSLPKYRIPQGSSDRRAVFDLVRDELLMDGNSRQNVATFCTTYADDEVRHLMNIAIDKNMIDKDEYPQTAEIEMRCVHMLADLWHANKAWKTTGCSTTGSSEACMLAGLALKWRWKQRRAALNMPVDKPNFVCGPVQVCWEKFARYFDVEMRQVPLSGDSLGLQPEQLAAYCDENTIGVVATLGITFTCVYEPVKALAAALDNLQRDVDLDIPIHVDAASGGFVAPFIQPDLEWDFSIERVKSINASGHKYGLAPLGVGWVVWRSMQDLPDELIFRVDYLGGNMPTFALNFSRPAGQIIAQYYMLLRLGREGYRQIQQECSDTAQVLADGLKKLDMIELVYDGRGALPAVCYKLRNPEKAGFTLFDLSDRVRMHGWQIASYKMPPGREATIVQRILIRRGITRDMATFLLKDISDAIANLRANPVAHSSTGSSFHHN